MCSASFMNRFVLVFDGARSVDVFAGIMPHNAPVINHHTSGRYGQVAQRRVPGSCRPPEVYNTCWCVPCAGMGH